jgi:hypothetical protein
LEREGAELGSKSWLFLRALSRPRYPCPYVTYRRLALETKNSWVFPGIQRIPPRSAPGTEEFASWRHGTVVDVEAAPPPEAAEAVLMREMWGGLGLEHDSAEELEEARKVGADGSTAAVAASAAVGCTHWPYSWSGVTASPTTRQGGGRQRLDETGEGR